MENSEGLLENVYIHIYKYTYTYTHIFNNAQGCLLITHTPIACQTMSSSSPTDIITRASVNVLSHNLRLLRSFRNSNAAFASASTVVDKRTAVTSPTASFNSRVAGPTLELFWSARDPHKSSYIA